MPHRNEVIRLALIILTLTAAVFACYAQVVGFDFICYDDPDYVTANPTVIAGLTWPGIKWAFAQSHAANWHPVTWVSHMLDCQFFGLSATGPHLINVALHLCNTSLLFLLLHRFTGAVWRSAVVAALFGLHPMHVESVAWVSERKDVLSTFFFLLTLWAYSRSTDDGLRANRVPRDEEQAVSAKCSWNRFYWLSLVFFAFGLMSKPMLVTLPFVLLLLDYWPLGRLRGARNELLGAQTRRALIEKVPFFFLSLLSCVVTVAVQRAGGAVAPLEKLGIGARLLNAVISYANYVLKLIWPTHLAVVYPYFGHSNLIRVAVCTLGLATVTVATFKQRKGRPYMLVGWLWYLGTLVPVIGLIQVGNQPMADRYTYIPSIGLLLMLVWGVAEFSFSRPALRWSVVGGSVAVLLACALLSSSQIATWQNSATLFQHALKISPRNPIAYNNLGLYYANSHELAQATTCYRAALEINPGYQHAWNNLGCVCIDLKQYDQAVTNCEMALRLDSSFADAHNNLGTALIHLGRTGEGINQYGEALRFRPGYAEAHYNLANALAGQGDIAGAANHFAAALDLNPIWAEAHNNFGFVLAQQGKAEQAAMQFNTAALQNPRMWQTYYGLSAVYASVGKFNEAQELAKRASDVALAAGEAESARKCQELVADIASRQKSVQGEVIAPGGRR